MNDNFAADDLLVKVHIPKQIRVTSDNALCELETNLIYLEWNILQMFFILVFCFRQQKKNFHTTVSMAPLNQLKLALIIYGNVNYLPGSE